MVEVEAPSEEQDHVAHLTALGQRFLEGVDRGPSELSVLLCDDATIAELNAQYRHRPEPTDVLSFPQGDELLLGDVVISIPTAARQALEAGHALSDELALLLAHGLLHLLGYDHQTDTEAAEMRAEEQRLLGLVGVAVVGLVGRAGAD